MQELYLTRVLVFSGALVAVMLGAAPLAAQDKAPLTFEVATIKPSAPQQDAGGMRMAVRLGGPGGGLNLSGVPLRFLITFAYDILEFQVSGGPSWVNNERWDVVAKGPGTESPSDPRSMTPEQMRTVAEQNRERLRSLLAERFQLVLKKDVKEGPVYELVVGKSGHKLVEAKTEATGPRGMMRMGRGSIDGQGMTIDVLPRMLSREVGRVVVDKTGLKGRYDIKLEWTPEMGGGGHMGPGPGGLGGGEATAPLSGPSLFTALQEQLGLRLESAKGPVETFVIEKVERPSEN